MKLQEQAEQLKKQEQADSFELDQKILDDFHGNKPIFNNTFKGILPIVSTKAKIYLNTVLNKDEYFRLAVDGGGCSGFQYGFTQETEIEKDIDILICKDPQVIVDKASLEYLWGATLDCIQETFGVYLKVNNPGAKQGCGCGSSFSYG